jgi:hypothetical protein
MSANVSATTLDDHPSRHGVLHSNMDDIELMTRGEDEVLRNLPPESKSKMWVVARRTRSSRPRLVSRLAAPRRAAQCVRQGRWSGVAGAPWIADTSAAAGA